MKIDYAIVSEQGLREEMEDTYCLSQPFQENKQTFFAGVFDGHKGSCAAQYAARELPILFVKKLEARLSVCTAFERTYEEISRALGYQQSGACAVTMFIRPPMIFFANVGDCELFVFRNGSLETLSVNHRVGNRKEEERIRATGGEVNAGYVWLNHDGLQMCRALGDPQFRSVGLIATPDCGHIKVTTPCTALLGTDGLFDMAPRTAIEHILRSVSEVEAQAACLKGLVESVTPYDNYTFIVLSLQP
ncbi:MAG: PP2C family protein-serine/threonine phosphatase [Patescibacteria group bacterium]